MGNPALNILVFVINSKNKYKYYFVFSAKGLIMKIGLENYDHNKVFFNVFNLQLNKKLYKLKRFVNKMYN